MPDSLSSVFLFYLLPLLNVVILLTVNKRTKFRNPILVLVTVLNVVGLSMLHNGAVITDDKTHIRTVRVLYFFVLLELFLLIIWNRKPPKAPQNENARDQ